MEELANHPWLLADGADTPADILSKPAQPRSLADLDTAIVGQLVRMGLGTDEAAVVASILRDERDRIHACYRLMAASKQRHAQQDTLPPLSPSEAPSDRHLSRKPTRNTSQRRNGSVHRSRSSGRRPASGRPSSRGKDGHRSPSPQGVSDKSDRSDKSPRSCSKETTGVRQPHCSPNVTTVVRQSLAAPRSPQRRRDASSEGQPAGFDFDAQRPSSAKGSSRSVRDAALLSPRTPRERIDSSGSTSHRARFHRKSASTSDMMGMLGMSTRVGPAGPVRRLSGDNGSLPDENFCSSGEEGDTATEARLCVSPAPPGLGQKPARSVSQNGSPSLPRRTLSRNSSLASTSSRTPSRSPSIRSRAGATSPKVLSRQASTHKDVDDDGEPSSPLAMPSAMPKGLEFLDSGKPTARLKIGPI